MNCLNHSHYLLCGTTGLIKILILLEASSLSIHVNDVFTDAMVVAVDTVNKESLLLSSNIMKKFPSVVGFEAAISLLPSSNCHKMTLLFDVHVNWTTMLGKTVTSSSLLVMF